MRSLINQVLARFNYTIKRIVPADPEQYFLDHLPEELAARRLLLNYYQISTILDVGANTGQYASLTRRLGYKGRIISFEPIQSAYAQLMQNSANDNEWSCVNYALGSEPGTSIIHISKNSYSSSLLDILPSHLEFDNNSAYIDEQEIEIKTLDSVFNQLFKKGENYLLKIDTQGFEMNVLKGSRQSLSKIAFIQLEMSVEPLYTNETLFYEMYSYLINAGFELFTFENGIRNPKNGKLLQLDGIFINKAIIQ